MRKAEFLKDAADRHFVKVDIEALLDNAPEVDASPRESHRPASDGITRSDARESRSSESASEKLGIRGFALEPHGLIARRKPVILLFSQGVNIPPRKWGKSRGAQALAQRCLTIAGRYGT
jgi:hypothetical protein